MSKIFGANWQTTVWGGLQAIFTAIVMGTLTFPDDWSDHKKVAIFIGACISTFFGVTFAVKAKSREVTGGTKQQTANGSLAEPGTQSLVDDTIIASIQSGEQVTPEQREGVAGMTAGSRGN